MTKNLNSPRLLVSNDDGVNASGLTAIIDSLTELNLDIIAIAPESEQSGKSHSISIDHILRIKEIKKYKNVPINMCTGTPSDCVKAGLYLLCQDKKPDLVISGINHGYNYSVSTLYSGTIAAAQEGCIAGISSIAFSLGNFNAESNDFSHIFDYVKHIIKISLANPLPKGVYLNVNIPPIKDIKGIKICRLAKGKFTDSFTKHIDPRNKPYYWLSEEFDITDHDTDHDFYYLQEGYITIVPIHFDVTAYNTIEKLERLYQV